MLLGLAGIAAAESPESTTPLPPSIRTVSGHWLTSRTLAGNGRALVLSTTPLPTSAPVEVMLFACPNGNTAEETLGDTETSGPRWRHGIQNIAAQWLHLLDHPTRPIQRHPAVLAIVEAPKLSWPAHVRATSASAVLDLFPALKEELFPFATIAHLAAHSGGGALVHLAIASETTPTLHNPLSEAKTISLLDANYAFDGAIHGPPLMRWISAAQEYRQFVSLAYDDRDVVLNGRRIIGPAGGTLRANLRIAAALDAQSIASSITTDKATTTVVAFGGRLRLQTLENPENRILHTVMVERNGLIHAMVPGGISEWMEPAVYRKFSASPAALDGTVRSETRIREQSYISAGVSRPD